MKKAPRTRGMTLVITLSILVLVTVAVLAFFSRAQLNRKVSFSSTNLYKADSIARSAEDIVIGELREEMHSGSVSPLPTATPSGATIYQPKTPADSVPKKQTGLSPDAAGAQTLLNISANNTAVYVGGRILGSNIGIDKRSTNGRTQSVWFSTGPKLGSNGALPTWVYLSRQGVTATPDLTARQGNAAHVIGRFAYTVYDTGALADMNAIGYPQTLNANTDYIGRRGNLAQVNLAALNGMTPALSDALISWRNPQEATNPTTYANYMVGSSTVAGRNDGFTKPRADDRFFLNRQDLLRYAKTYSVPDAALPSMSAFSRTLNAPVARPSASDPDPTLFQFNGKPLMRFPLSRLALLAKDPATLTAADKTNIATYFGLTPDPNNSVAWKRWSYRGGAVSTIKTLGVVAGEGRQPDFFELLQAAIVNGSLGKASGDTLAFTSGVDAKSIYQVMRIGANLIDQYDHDNYPTTLLFDSLPFYGVEDLPYLNKVLLKPYWPDPQWSTRTPPIFPLIIFEVWNPHQTPNDTVSGPTRFRVRANDDAKYRTFYQGNPGTGSNVVSYPFGVAYNPLPNVGGDPIEFQANTADFRDPGVLRNTSAPSYRTDIKCNAISLPTITQSIPAAWRINPSPYWPKIYVTTELQYATFILEYWDGAKWQPYSTFAGFAESGGVSGINTYASLLPSTIADPNGAAYQKADPRTFRFGSSFGSLGSSTSSAVQYNDISLHPSATDQKIAIQKRPQFMNLPPTDTSTPRYLSKLATNNEADHTYPDNDGKTRVADGVGGVNPYATNDATARPLILNRPFRSVGELGYVFRDQPWKTLDLFSASSGDAALLDYFCIDDADVVGGGVNVNSAPASLLTAMLNNTAAEELNPTSVIANPSGIATQIVALQGTPLLSRGELATRLVGSSSYPATGNEANIKTRREAAARALGSMSATRTWNLLVDVVAQSGNLIPNATSAGQFSVEGERRFWLSVAIDRYTGQVISRQLEEIDDE